MSTETSNPTSAAQSGPEPLNAETSNGFAFFQSVLILCALGVAAYKVLDAALRLL